MWELQDSVVPRAMMKLYARGPADRAIGMAAVNLLYAASEVVVSPAAVNRVAEGTVDCKR